MTGCTITKDDIFNPSARLSTASLPIERAELRHTLWRQGAPVAPLTEFPVSEVRDLAPRLVMSHAAMSAEAGHHLKALTLTRAALNKKPRALLEFGYAGLFDVLCCLDDRIQGDHRNLQAATAQLCRGFGKFTDLVSDPDKTICVVGNSPQTLNQKLGEFIDSHHIVIRFNSFRAGGIYRDDFGHKTDIWVRATRFRDVWRRETNRFPLVVVPDPAYWRSPAGLTLAVDAHLLQIPHDVVDPLQFFDVTSQLGHPPSSGIMILGWLRHIRGSLTHISQVGFGLEEQSKGTMHYFSSRSRGSDVPHNWEAERALLNRWRDETSEGATP